MTDEDRAAHDRFAAAIVESLAPEGAIEIQLAQRIATDSWRLNRSSAIEDNLFALGHLEHIHKIDSGNVEIDAALTAAQVFRQEAKQLQLLSLYEQRNNRAIERNMKQLQQLQAIRREQEAQRQHALEVQRQRALEEAALLTLLTQRHETNAASAEAPTETVPPNGFVFSKREIDATIERLRLRETPKTPRPGHLRATEIARAA